MKFEDGRNLDGVERQSQKPTLLILGGVMSIRIRIDEVEHDLEQADEHWVISQIEQRKRDNGQVCVQILINEGGLNMRLLSADCNVGGEGGRPPTNQEQEIFDLWDQHVLRGQDIVGGQVVAFLKQLRRIV